jgi:MFS family permease
MAAPEGTGEGVVSTSDRTSIWHNPTLAAFVVSRFVSMTGTQMTWVALPWFVLSTTGSPVKMTFVLFAEMIPFGVFGLTLGALVDRLDLKRVMVVTDVVNAIVMASLPLLWGLGLLQYWMIVVAAVLVGSFSAPSRAAEKAIIPDIVGDDEAALVAGNTAVQLAVQVTTMLGPVLAGLLIGIIGNVNVLWLDAGSYALSAAIVGLGVRTLRRERVAAEGNLFADTAEGLRFLWHNRLLRITLIYIVVLVFAFAGLIDAALPVFVKDTLHAGPVVLSVMLGAWGVGSVAGMLAYGALSKRFKMPLGWTLIVLSFGLALPLWIPPLTQTIVPAAFGFLLAGLCDGPLTVLLHTMQQVETPVELRGRVFSAIAALFMTSAPLGVLAAGPVLEAGGAVPWMLAMATLFTVVAALATLSPTIRRA